jgi:cbb3-type cytochrome oxidase subunit 3
MAWFDFAMSLRPYFMVWVVLVLAAILTWYCWPRRHAKFEEHGRIPLNDDQPLP